MVTHERQRLHSPWRTAFGVALLTLAPIAFLACSVPGPSIATPTAAGQPSASPEPAVESTGPELTFVLPTKWPFATEPVLSPAVPPPVLP